VCVDLPVVNLPDPPVVDLPVVDLPDPQLIEGSNAELVTGHLPRRACHRISSRLLAFLLSGITATLIH
jgi:hypothetical protein